MPLSALPPAGQRTCHIRKVRRPTCTRHHFIGGRTAMATVAGASLLRFLSSFSFASARSRRRSAL